MVQNNMNIRRAKRARYVWLLLCTSAVISAMWFYDAAQEAAIPRVETVAVRADTVEEIAIVSGHVRAAEGTEVAVTVPCVAGEIAVEVGDRVKEGDVLMQVDRAATLALAVGAGLSGEDAVMASAALPQTVVAPHDGIVSAVSAAKGDTLTGGSPCVVLSENGDIEIAVTLRESVVPRIAVGQAVTVSGAAFRKDGYRGTVSAIASSARSRLVGAVSETVVDAVVTLLPGEADDSLLIGLSAKAAVTVERRENILLVPYECLTQDEEGQTAVYCLRGDTACRRAVTLGREYTAGAEVLDGLQEGDVLICAPERLSGETVRVYTEETV